MPGRPVVTFLTDFGLADGYVGAMKGALLRAAPDVLPVDLTHDVPPHDVLAGAFLLAGAARWFPPGTVHVAVVDPGVGTPRRGLAARAGDWFFVAPDNGLLELVLREQPAAEVRRIANPDLCNPDPHPTFHGRDVFAPVAGALARGVSLAEIGPAVDDPVRLPLPEVRAEERGLAVPVLHVDRFGNVVLGVRAGELRARLGDGPWRIVEPTPAGPVFPARTYGEIPPGSLALLAGSSGWAELALDRAPAADRLGVAPGHRVLISRR